MIKRFIVFGPPGVGKGTLASLVSQKYGFEHISTGNIFRSQISSNSELGIKLKEIVESGGYVPDSITNEIVKKTLADLEKEQKSYILDGYPRTLNQIEFLFSLNKAQEYSVWFLEAPNEIILKRLSGRRICPSCNAQYHIYFKKSKLDTKCEIDQSELIQRKDDQESSIIKRLEIYEKQTNSLKKYFKELGILVEIDASKDREEILKELEQKVSL